MLTNLKVFATVVAVGGGFIGVPVTLWQTNFLAVAQPKIRTITQKLPEPMKVDSNKGNCEVEKLSPENENLLLSQKQKGNFYIEVFCSNTGIGTGAGAMPNDWTGLFPAELFENERKLLIGTRFNLETQDATNNGTTRTVFKGENIKGAVIGEWDAEQIRSVSFPENPKIKNKLYLIFH